MWEQIRANKRRSIFLITAMAALLIALGYGIGFVFSPSHAFIGVPIAVAVWLIMWLVAVAAGSKLVLASAGAREIAHDDVPKLFNVVEEMTIAAGLPRPPKVYVIDCDAPNAFACGTPEKSAVAVTTGLLTRLNRDELQGVIAHEIGHIKNQDTKFMTLAGILMGSIIIIADGFARSMFYAGRGSRRSSSRGGGQGQAVVMLVAILFAILAPILAQLLYFACSRRREYLADASAARFTRYPEGLASALEKISAGTGKMKDVNRVTAPMYIINPLKKTSAAVSIFSTHPPTDERVRILRSMAGGAGLAQYEAACQKVGGRKILGAQTLAEADQAETRAPSAKAEESDLTKTREAVDVLHRLGGFLFLQCACGLKMKVPPTYKKKSVKCPRCETPHLIPVAAVAATAAAIAADKQADAKKSATAVKPEEELSYRFKPGKWQAFRCVCGKTIQISPSFSSDRVRCRACDRVVRIVRS